MVKVFDAVYMFPDVLFNVGCYNVKAQNFKYGEPFELEMLEEILDYCAPSYIEG